MALFFTWFSLAISPCFHWFYLVFPLHLPKHGNVWRHSFFLWWFQDTYKQGRKWCTLMIMGGKQAILKNRNWRTSRTRFNDYGMVITDRTSRHRLQHIKRINFREGAKAEKHTQHPPGEPEGRKRRSGEEGINRILSEIIFFNTNHAPSTPPSIPPHREIISPSVIG